MSEFVTWEMLGTYAGALVMVSLLTQLTKGLGFVAKIPTQVWSYILTLAVLFPAEIFTGQMTASAAFLTFFNAIVVSLAANGGFSGIRKIIGKDTDEGGRDV